MPPSPNRTGVALPWAGLAAIAGLASCVVGEVDLTGKACPCIGGWVCDEATDTCRRETSGTTSTSGDDDSASSRATASTSESSPDGSSGGSGGVTDGTGSTPGAFDVVEFSADWATPNSIHWRWSVQGQPEDFHAWEVRIATSVEALDSDDALVFDGIINPELDRYWLRNTGDEEPVNGTITDGLTESTEYFARLHVFDTAGGRSTSPNIAVRSTTDPPTAGEPIFADDDPFPPGIALPECYQRTDVAPFGETTHHFQVHHRCESDGSFSCTLQSDPTSECWENFRLQNMEITLPGLNAGDFADAYLEVQIAIDAPADMVGHGWWSQVGVHAADDVWMYDGITFRADGQYRRYQIPLTQLGLSHETMGGMVQGVRVGSQWSHDSIIRVDEAWVRW